MNLLKEPSVSIRTITYSKWAEAVRETQDPKLIDEIIRSGSEASRKYVSTNKNLTKENCQTLYTTGDGENRARLVMNRATPNQIFKLLWFDPDPLVFRYFEWLNRDGERYYDKWFITLILSFRSADDDELDKLREAQALPTVMAKLPVEYWDIAMKLVEAAFHRNEYIDIEAIDQALMEVIEDDTKAFDTALTLYGRVV